ncbi:hypothetical protein EZV62_022912 [Acer yangbiense]|uniref:Uncharacterized protein n=1 Tax=Acer yangbiense TaxID=1000413 RepID=A0A5C7H026_9ROSI|nr:hypothetical protein EZV62_022912 [Acer yangbiense]
MVRPPCCDKLNVKRGIWTAEEDAKILAYVSKHGAGNWTAVPKKAGYFGGLRRCGKSCRLRWTNYLRPDLKHDSFTPQEEEMIIRLHAAIGSRWAIIAQQLPGRTDNDVKNYWNTKLRKKLSDMGIDPVTHKPFSQILVDYGNIGGLYKCGNRIGSLNRDMIKNAFMSKSQHLYQPSPPPPGFSNINSHLMMSTTMVSSQAESIIPGGLLNNNNNTSDNMIMNSLGNYSMNSSVDLLAQLQAIKLVTEASNCANNMSAQFYHEGSLLSSSSLSLPSSSSSSSSSSTCSTAGQEKSPLNFSWQDFLLDEDALLSTDPQEQNNIVEQSQNVILLPSQINNENYNTTQTNNTVQRMDYGAVPSYEFPATSSGASSFVEAMVDRENEMFLEFPDLLEDPCFYN